MSDFYTSISISRDDMASMLGDNDQGQTAYVLAETADRLEPGTMAYDDLCDSIAVLDDDQKCALLKFANALVASLS